jgi:hypothetical protein
MNYTETADRYVEQILMMKDVVKLRDAVDRVTHIEWEQSLKIGGYDELVKRYRKSEDRNIGTVKTAVQISERILQDLDGKDNEHPSPIPDMSDEDYQRLRSEMREFVNKQVNKRFNLAFSEELDSKFQKTCIEEAESIIESCGLEPYDQATKRKIEHISDLCQIRTVPALARTWRLLCNRCTSDHTYSLIEAQVRTLVHDGFLKLDTTQSKLTMLDLPYHLDLGRHEQTITLGQLVRQYLQSN